MTEGVPIRALDLETLQPGMESRREGMPLSAVSLENLEPGMESRRERKELLEGFPQTASFIAKDPAKTTLIFRRFDQLAVRNILYMEARLAALESLQKDYDRDDVDFNNENEPITTAARSWEDFALIGCSSLNRHHNLPKSALARWGTQREALVKEYRSTAASGNVKRMSIEAVIEASNCEESNAAGRELELEQKAAEEAKFVYDNPLGCGPCSLALIRSRWELAAAIETSLKEYRAHESILLGLTKLK